MKFVGKYGSIMKTNTAVRSVQMTIKALDLPVEVVCMDVIHKKEQLNPEFLKINPQHSLPTFVDADGTVVWDSHAIMSYLVDKHTKQNDENSLYPMNLLARTLVNQRLFFEASVAFRTLNELINAYVHSTEKSPRPEIIEKAYKTYGHLENFLKKQQYLAGNNLTIADFSNVTTATSLDCIVPMEKGKYPNLEQWIDRCKSLPYYNDVNGGVDDIYKKMFARTEDKG